MQTTRTLTLFPALMLLALLFLAVSAPTAQAADPVIVRVTTSGMTAWPCGQTDWSSPCALQTALTYAASGSELWVAAGTYTPGALRTDTFQLKSGVALYGGFVGSETARTQRNFTAHVTILSGDIGTVGNSSDNAYHVVKGSGVTNTAVLDGFTVTGGRADGPPPDYEGGGMYNWAGSPTVRNVTFINNTSSTFAGGMYNYSSSPALTNVTFIGNTSTNGGGFFSIGGSPTLTDVIFTGNSATNGGGMHNSGSPTLANVTFTSNTATFGGGMDNSGNATLTNVTFSNNSATNSGGGMDNYGGSPTLTNVTFSGNSAALNGGGINNINSTSPTLTNVTFSSNSALWGGGMYNDGGNPSLTHVTFSGGIATFGGGMYNHAGSPTLTNVTFSSNSASLYGAGMRNDSSNATLTNVTFANNTASYGGGTYNDGSNLIVTNATFSGNLATGGGGAVANLGSDPTMRNSIFWGNTPSDSQIYNDGASTPSLSYSVVQGGYAGGTVIITADPLLGALGNYGGSTETIPLLSGSSAIDAGNNGVCPAADQRGVPRPQGPRCDIGAFEVVGPVQLPLLRK